MQKISDISKVEKKKDCTEMAAKKKAPARRKTVAKKTTKKVVKKTVKKTTAKRPAKRKSR